MKAFQNICSCFINVSSKTTLYLLGSTEETNLAEKKKLFEFKMSTRSNLGTNRPFPNCFQTAHQSETRWTTFQVKMGFHSHANKTNFLIKGCAPSLALIARLKTLRALILNSQRRSTKNATGQLFLEGGDQ